MFQGGRFVVIDGSNGAGKSTVISALEKHLQMLNRSAVFTREPGGTPIGEQVRKILLSQTDDAMSDVTELLLFAAARAQHVRQKILPALEQGKIVISDRFDSATVSFQHHARGLPLELINTLNKIAVDQLRPDLTIILDLDPRDGLARARARGGGLDRLEKQEMAFLDRARDGYLQQARQSPEYFKVIDASQGLEQVVAEAIEAVRRVLDLA